MTQLDPVRVREALKVIGRAWARSELPPEFPMSVVDKVFGELLEGTEVKWCAEHESSGNETSDQCWAAAENLAQGVPPSLCRIVSRRLVGSEESQ